MSLTIQKIDESINLTDIRKIFFENSSIKEFKDENHRQQFFDRWLGQYLTRFPDWCWVAMDSNQVLGYIVASEATDQNLNQLAIPGMEIFTDLYKSYPIGLHINVASAGRGQGIGEKLIKALTDQAHARNCRGVHAITSLGDRNNSFYRKCQFSFEMIREYKGFKQLFMGLKLGE